MNCVAQHAFPQLGWRSHERLLCLRRRCPGPLG